MWKTVVQKLGPYILISILVLSLWGTVRKMEVYKDRADTLETTISDLNQEIKRTEIVLNDSIKVYQTEVKNLNVTQNNLKAKYNDLLAASKLKAKDVGNVTEIASVIHSVDTVVAYVDSFGGIKARLDDSFVTIDVNVLPDRNTIIGYEVRDSLTVISVQKKHSWLFGLIKWTEHKSTRVINNNPKANITSLQVLDVFE